MKLTTIVATPATTMSYPALAIIVVATNFGGWLSFVGEKNSGGGRVIGVSGAILAVLIEFHLLFFHDKDRSGLHKR